MLMKKAKIEDFKLKIMVWGKPGIGKTRWALNSPKPMVIDSENSSLLYSNEFDFQRVTINELIPEKKNVTTLTTNVIKEILEGEYNEIGDTLIIDSASDLFDNLESLLASNYQKNIQKDISTLNAMQKTIWYSYRREKTRELLNKILSLPVNVIFTVRSKLKWEVISGQMTPNGIIPDCPEILEFLVDCVVFLDEEKQTITKTRLFKAGDYNMSTFNDLMEIVRNK